MNDKLTFASADASPVTPQLWVGGDLGTRNAPHAQKQLDELAAAGLTHILDTRLEWDDTSFVAEHRPDIAYLHLGVDDAGQRMQDEWFDEGTAFVVGAVQNPQNRVLVHCHMGINRGPSMGYAALLALGWSPASALAAIVEARPVAWIDYWQDATDWWARKQGLDSADTEALIGEAAQWRDRFGIGWRADDRFLR